MLKINKINLIMTKKAYTDDKSALKRFFDKYKISKLS